MNPSNNYESEVKSFQYSVAPEVDFETGEITLKEIINGVEQKFIKQVLKTKEEATRKALIALGWTPSERTRLSPSPSPESKQVEEFYTYWGKYDIGSPEHQCALDAWNHQQENIDRLKKENDILSKTKEAQSTIIQRWSDKNAEYMKENSSLKSQITQLHDSLNEEGKKVDRYETALKDIKRDCENCDWSCNRCGQDCSMTETDIYYYLKRALSDNPQSGQVI